MSIHVACPHCQGALMVPDGCGGQTARCPTCLAEFTIPITVVPVAVAAAPVSAAPVRAAAAANKDGATPEEMERAQLAVQQTAADEVAIQSQIAHTARQKNRESSRLAWLKRFQAGRVRLDHSVGRIGGFFVTLAVGTAALLVLCSFFSPSAFGYFAIVMIGMLLSGAAYLPFSLLPSDEQLPPLIERWTAQLQETTEVHDKLAAEADRLRQRHQVAMTTLRGLKPSTESVLAALRACQWQKMASPLFEKFLIRVFEAHGYSVEPVAPGANQAVDLVVSRGGARIALKVQGYTEIAVRNEVVQQAIAAAGPFRCGSSAVVTNTRFGSSARTLADRSNCRLIDAGQVPDLIEGRIAL